MQKQPIKARLFRDVLTDSIINQDKVILNQLIEANASGKEAFRMIGSFEDLLKVTSIKEDDSVLIITDKQFLNFLEITRNERS